MGGKVEGRSQFIGDSYRIVNTNGNMFFPREVVQTPLFIPLCSLAANPLLMRIYCTSIYIYIHWTRLGVPKIQPKTKIHCENQFPAKSQPGEDELAMEDELRRQILRRRIAKIWAKTNYWAKMCYPSKTNCKNKFGEDELQGEDEVAIEDEL